MVTLEHFNMFGGRFLLVLFVFLHWSNIYRPNNKAFECFRFCSWIRRLIRIFNIWRWLSWCGVSFPVNWVNAKWDSMSTVSTRSETPRQLSQQGIEIFVNVGALCIDSFDVESHSMLTKLTWNLCKCWYPLRWLSWCGVLLCVDSVDMKSHSVLTQLTGSLTPHWLSVRKMNQAKTGIHNHL